MLTDDSEGEQCAIQKAFCGLIDGEMEVTYLLCKVHILQTIRTKLSGSSNIQVQEHLMAALYNQKTKPECEESIHAAIDAASPRQKYYFEKEWWITRADWAHYARCHSALLLQIPSTNSVESWHASLKFKVKKKMRQWSLLGFVKHLANIEVQWDRKTAKTASEFYSKHLSDKVHWPEMRKLPYPIQKLCLSEQERVLGLITKDARPT